jgi:adenosylmethionine-8-amino-7-oxononanoate aminotransferase
VEPVVGTGAVPLERPFLAALFEARRQYGLLLVADEVTTGFGRTSPTIFASHLWAEPADIIVTAKGLTNGTQAASAVLVSAGVAEAFDRDDVIVGHAETQAGTAVACAAILATIGEMDRQGTLERGTEISRALDVELEATLKHTPLVAGASGAGCLRAIHLRGAQGEVMNSREISDVVDAIHDVGALVLPGPSCIQLAPALVYSRVEVSELLLCVHRGLTNHEARGRSKVS